MTRPAGVVGVAASAGGVEALQKFVSGLPADLPLAVLVVLHISPKGPSVLPHILARAGKLPVRHAADGERLEAGLVLVAPPDRHLAAADSHAAVSRGPREGGHRPSADRLLRSLATTFGERSAGVVLSGTMDDGAAGLNAIRLAGGLALVQSPDDALFSGMPLAAIAGASPEVVAPVSDLADALVEWAAALKPDRRPTGSGDRDGGGSSSAIASSQVAGAPASDAEAEDDELVAFTCPECGGTLWRRQEHGVERFRCRVGHSFSAASLLVGKQEALEAALWAAIVALEERRDLTNRIAARAEAVGGAERAERYRARAAETERTVGFLRSTIETLSDVLDGAAEEASEDA